MLGIQFDRNLYTSNCTDKILDTIATFDINGFWEFIKKQREETLVMKDRVCLIDIVHQIPFSIDSDEIKSKMQEPPIVNKQSEDIYQRAAEALKKTFLRNNHIDGIWYAYLYYFVFVVMQFHAWGQDDRKKMQGYNLFFDYVQQHPEYEISHTASDFTKVTKTELQEYTQELKTFKTECVFLQNYLDKKINDIQKIQDRDVFVREQQVIDNHVEDRLNFLNNVFIEAAPLRENLRNMTMLPLIYEAMQKMGLPSQAHTSNADDDDFSIFFAGEQQYV